MSGKDIVAEGMRDYQKLSIVIFITALAIIGVVFLYDIMSSVIGTKDLPYWMQAIIISIVALVAYSIKDYVREIIKKYLSA